MKARLPILFLCSLLATAMPGVLWAGTAEEDWQAVVALDAGPQLRSRSGAETQAAIIAHLGSQEKALRGFLAGHPEDPRAFEAGLRLARLLGLRGQMQDDPKSGAEAARVLEGLAAGAKPEQRAELDFARLALGMRRIKNPTPAEREALLGRAQTFQRTHPEDRRMAALLAEIATLFDGQPGTKMKLLRDAQALAREPDLQSRIGDDLRRLEALGQVLTFSAELPSGGTLELADYRGRVVVLVFFAVWSQPSTEALAVLQNNVAAFPKDRVQMLGVSLDTKPEALAGYLKEKKISWPVACDGKGWEGRLVRLLGINALPSVWLLDRTGKVRSLNALDNSADQLRQVLHEP